MSMEELVRKARTVRRYDESDPIREEDLRKLVDMVRIVSCGGNLQKLRYRIISAPGECRAVFHHIAWAGALKDWPGPGEGERPTGYIAILGEGASTVNTGIAAQTIQLAACEMGYGCCMLGSLERDAIMDALCIPDPYTIQLLLALGKPAETVVIEEASKGEDLNYYRTADGVHHVPKLKLEEVLVG